VIALDREDTSKDGLTAILALFCLGCLLLVSRESSSKAEILEAWLLVLSLPESLKVSLTEDLLGSDHDVAHLCRFAWVERTGCADESCVIGNCGLFSNK
jgi:hypothetical protein